MDPRLREYYERELQHLREMGAEFAAQYPKIAARLGMRGIEVADPYVERLLEGFGFLAARIQLGVAEEMKMYQCAKVILLANLHGYAPQLAVEFGRKVLFSTERPTFTELDDHVREVKKL